MNNIFEPHYMMIDSGTFWRCDHGETGVYHSCWRCGLKYPDKLLNHIKDGTPLREKEYAKLEEFLERNKEESILTKKQLSTLRKVVNYRT